MGFTIHFAPGVCIGYGQATATVATVRQALDFIGEFAPGGFGANPSYRKEKDGRYVIEVYDWCDCWFCDPPVIAWIIAPLGFEPTRDPFSNQLLAR